MSWKSNPIMTWGNKLITDHGRSSLNMTSEMIGSTKRMHDGTLRRQHIATKRTWSTSWENIPSKKGVSGSLSTADGNQSGADIEDFYFDNPGEFTMVLRRGSARNKTTPVVADSSLPYEDEDFYIAKVMFSDFSKEVSKRGKGIDLWNISVTLQEV